MAVWNLRRGWNPGLPTAEKLALFGQTVTRSADPERLLDRLASRKRVSTPAGPLFATAESRDRACDAVAF
jgi:hypothetical protein